MSDATVLRAVVIGTGFGLRVHVPALRRAGFDVVALVGTDRERTARRAERVGVPGAFTDLDTALDETDADAVTIATPPQTHLPLVEIAARRGVHLICEKPLSLDTTESARMLACVEAAGVVAMVGNEFRWDPLVGAVRGLLASGRLGVPRQATIVRLYGILAGVDAGAPGWWFDTERGGGWLGANGSHTIDHVIDWFGPIQSVSGTTHHPTDRGPGAADDGFTVQLRTMSGVEILIQESAAVHGESTELTRVWGTEASVNIDDGSCWIDDGSGPVAVEVPAEETGATTDDDKRPWTGREIAAYTHLAAAFRQRILGVTPPDGPVPPTLASGHEVMRVLDAIHASARDGGWVEIARPEPSVIRTR